MYQGITVRKVSCMKELWQDNLMHENEISMHENLENEYFAQVFHGGKFHECCIQPNYP